MYIFRYHGGHVTGLTVNSIGCASSTDESGSNALQKTAIILTTGDGDNIQSVNTSNRAVHTAAGTSDADG